MKKQVLKITAYLCVAILILYKFPSPIVTSATPQSKQIPIIMYHSFLKDEARANEFIVSPNTFENDIVYLKENGYQTITLDNLINYVYNYEFLPEKPILITFDDGYYNNYEYAFPILKKYDMTAVISPIGKQTAEFSKTKEENVTWAYITDRNILEMYDSKIIEFANHSYDLHNLQPRKGVLKLSSESIDDYTNSFQKDIAISKRLFLDVGIPDPLFYTYPFGSHNSYSEEIIKNNGFLGSFAAESRISTITQNNPQSLFSLGRYNRPNDISTEEFFSNIENALNKNPQ